MDDPLIRVLVAYLITLWIANIAFCYWLADEKGRFNGAWALLALMFFTLATLVLVGAPDRTEKPEQKSK